MSSNTIQQHEYLVIEGNKILYRATHDNAAIGFLIGLDSPSAEVLVAKRKWALRDLLPATPPAGNSQQLPATNA